MKFRKAVAYVLAVTMIMGDLTMICKQQSVHAADTITEETSILNAMGISAVDSDGYITRGDFTALIVQAAGVEHDGMMSCPFYDVSGDQVEYVSAAAMVGYVNGIDDGRFYPDDIISVDDAFTIALRVLGFNQLSGTDMRKSIIEQLKLNDSIQVDGRLNCTKASKLIMNMLEAEYADYDGKTVSKSEESFMYKVHGVYRIHGTVNGTSGISMPEYPEIKDDEVCIDKTVFENKAGIGYEFFGKYVTAYIKETDADDVLIWFKGNRQSVISIYGSDIDSVTGFDKNDSGMPHISYTTDGRNKKTKSIYKNALVYINGVNTVALSNSDLMPDSGIVRLIDADDNNTIDIIVIDRYDYYMVDAVDYSLETIYDKGDKPDIDLNAFSEKDASIFYDGKDAGLSEIKAGIVLSVKCTYSDDGEIDHGRPIIIEILNGSITGTIERVGADNTITIGGNEYKYISTINKQPELGKYGVFYLGKMNEVVWWESERANDGLDYGYIMKVIPSEEDEITYAIVYDLQGIRHKLFIDDSNKVKYSGMLGSEYVSERKISRNDFYAVFDVKQLVRYKADGDRLTYIHKAIDGTSIAGYAGYNKDKFSLDYKSNSERLYAQFLSENYKVSTKTIMMGVSKTGTSDDDIEIGGYDFFGTDLTGLNIQIFDASETFVPAIVVLTYDDLAAAAKKPSNSFVSNRQAALITKTYQKVTEDNEIVTACKAYCGGVLVDIEPSKADLCDVKQTNWSGEGKKYFSELEPGDVIQYGVNSKGQVNLLHIIHDHSDKSSRYVMFNSNNHLSEMNTAFGRVKEFDSGSYFMLDSSETRKYPFGRYTPNVYVYNETTGKSERMLSLTHLSENDYVFVRCMRADVQDIIVYRE